MRAFLVRRLEDGTMRTVQANTPRGAMQSFVAQYGPPIGEEFGVKERGSGDWEFYRVNSGGIRRV
jgi:hypothetical protein